ncbi:MAG: UDPGP type 1 family protein [Myxococcota bacterium]|nr:UDPGP type 1 family protein [Myxococcota bacterium]
MQRLSDELRARFEAAGQEHVFRFWNELDEAGRTRLATQAEGIDPRALCRIGEQGRERGSGQRPLSPPPIERLPASGGDPGVRAEGRERGEALLREGRVAVLLLAGGQGTRLGFDGPKGTFPIGPVSRRSLFELHVQKLRGSRQRYGVPIPLYLMTSPATDAATRDFFAKHDHFGLPAEDVVCFRQATLPALGRDGRLLLEAPDRIAESPDGHGGAFQALVARGAADDMERRGITTLSCFQVDNPLVPAADAVFLGLHARARAEMSAKVVRKREPGENLGTPVVAAGRPAVVEYTEIDETSRQARGADGELVLWAGTPAIHALELAFVRRVAAAAERLLPLHRSAKKVPALDAAGRLRVPSEPNAFKLERFLFDALPAAERTLLLEVERDLEYAPVKNAGGGESPDTARRALVALYRRWLGAAGIDSPADRALELDHAWVEGGPAGEVRTLEDADARVGAEVW